jgi:uncharacterized membrane protein YdbT with pleckstrin-like domain
MTLPLKDSDKEVWRGRPWIIPYAAIRTFFTFVVAGIVIYLENLMGILYLPYGLPVLVWTLIAFFLIWILLTFNLLVLRSTHLYVLRVDSLEIKTGLLTTKNSVIVPSGFSDLEVTRTINSRIYNTGDIAIKTQSESDFTKKMVKVRDPMRVANLIRDVMARQIFKLDEGSQSKPN